MFSIFVSVLALCATLTQVLAAPRPDQSIRLWNGNATVEAGVRPVDSGDSVTSPDPRSVVKRELQYGCVNSLLCTQWVSEFECFAAMTKIADTDTYGTRNR